MKFTHATLITTTALTLTMGAAYADPNTLYLDQDGNGNSALIQQDIVGFYGDDAGGNDFGTSANHALQQGDDNKISYLNGSKNFHSNLSAGDNDVLEAKQLGDDNTMLIANNSYGSSGDTASSGNDLNSLVQNGSGNYANVVRQNADNGVIEDVDQTGDRNYLRIVQEHGNGNSVGVVRQNGDRNGFNQYNNTRQGTYIAQGGSGVGSLGNDNRVDFATIDGSYNGSTADQPGIYIVQQGSSNGLASSTAAIVGDYNQIKVLQTGDLNNFSVTTTGNRNFASLAQTGGLNNGSISQNGDFNTANATQIGNGNAIDAIQVGNTNTLNASFSGDNNGVGTMNGDAGALVSLSGNLTQGSMFQDSSLSLSGNTITYDVTGNGNLFAFAQIGGSNSIDGAVISSNNNQVAVLQTGDGNGTTFTQSGGGNNNISVSQ